MTNEELIAFELLRTKLIVTECTLKEKARDLRRAERKTKQHLVIITNLQEKSRMRRGKITELLAQQAGLKAGRLCAVCRQARDVGKKVSIPPPAAQSGLVKLLKRTYQDKYQNGK